ncbi:MAG: serine/threonine protein kinase [Deltaproteobacteria bacterium]|nr:serine/threonine protein kinase [Deltaproteobacteria bacterium]
MTSEIPRFEILGVLGAGAHGVVLLAQDYADAVNEPVALKVLRRFEESDAAPLERLRHEARILAWLTHPHIVQVHRLLEKDGLPIVVMEYVPGVSALELLGREPAGMPPAIAFEIARCAVLALRAAFETAGPDGQPLCSVHRDVKPANLLLASDGVLKVGDFGIATRAADALAPVSEGTFLGSPGYVAPERGRGAPEGTPVDVYALGATLYAMLTGRAPAQCWTAFKHRRMLDGALDQLAGTPVARDLIADLCSFDPVRRPTLDEVERRLVEALGVLGTPDLAAYAQPRVAAIRAERLERLESRQLLPDLAFLQDGGSVQDLEIDTPGPARGLALRPSRPPADLEARIAKLEAKNATARSLVSTLRALRGTRDPRAVSRGYALTEHADPRVAEAAWELLDAAC